MTDPVNCGPFAAWKSRHFQQDVRVLRGDGQQCSRRPGRRAPSLLPILESANRYSQQFRKADLGQPSLFPDFRNVGYVDHPAMLAALDLAQPLEYFRTDVTLGLSHFHLSVCLMKLNTISSYGIAVGNQAQEKIGPCPRETVYILFRWIMRKDCGKA
jgi:hypothetical protein